MKKKVAIPLENGVLSDRFGQASLFSVFDIEGDLIVNQEILSPPEHEPGILPKWLIEMGITDIIAGGMGQQAIQHFLNNNITVFVGVDQKSPMQLVEDFLNNDF